MKNLDLGFLLDIWQDLKEKRLAPVAVGLGVALIAIPALMMNGGGGDAADAPIPILAAAPTGGSKVEVVEDVTRGGSKLDSYKARDPFKGRNQGPAAAAGAPSGAASAPADVVPPPSTAPSTGGGSSMPSASDVAGITGSSPGSTGARPRSGGSGDAKAPVVPKAPVKHRNSFYNFRLDVKFGKPGRERRYRSLSRLTFLPSASLPVALFMGVNEARNKALFFVYPGLNHQGEGVCIPKPTNCDFVQLAEGDEHYFSAGDREFRMQLLAVKRVKASVDKRDRRVAQRRAARSGDGGAGAAGASYEMPWVVDGSG